MNKDRLKNWLIVGLVIILFFTWFMPYLSNINITGAFTTDYSAQQGFEDGSYTLGKADAPVKIITFSDFQCPFCARVLPALDQVKEEYIKTGEVKLVFKHMPLSFHSMAESAAWASICAGKQERFWDYHDALFANQNQLSREFMVSLAEELGLDKDDFDSCLRDRRLLRQLTADQQAASEVGVTGTPAFLINGQLLVGAQPFSAFKEVIDRKLAE